MTKQNTSIFIQFIASLAITTALLAGCSNDLDRAYREAELPDMILVATVDLASEAIVAPKFMQAAHDYELLITEGHKNPSRCCRYAKNDYRVDKLGLPRTGEEVMAVVKDEAALYAITLTDPSDTSLIEPLFGNRMHRHIMDEPQRGCEVVSGVRDGVLRAGVISHEVSVKHKAGYSTEELDYDATNNCFTSALLLLHGLPVSEAMNHEPYLLDIGRRRVSLAPDFKKIADRGAELLAQREK